MGRRLRVVVVGLGYAGETHLKSYARLPGVEAVALAGLEGDRLRELGETYGVPNLHRGWEGLVAREDLDAVSIGAPNHLHAPIAIAALGSGKHVLCEKPLARTGAEAQGILDAAQAAGRVLHVAFNHRERGDVRVLKKHLDGGNLGRIYHAKATWMRRDGIPGMGSWFTSKAMAGGGPLIDLGVHALDMVLYLMDEPEVETVTCATYAELGPRGRGGRGDEKTIVGDAYEVEDLATAFLRLRGGALIEVVDYGWQDTLRIYTDVAGVPPRRSGRRRSGARATWGSCGALSKPSTRVAPTVRPATGCAAPAS